MTVLIKDEEQSTQERVIEVYGRDTSLLEIPLTRIKIDRWHFLNAKDYITENPSNLLRPVLVDKTRQLLYGLNRLTCLRNQGNKTIHALMIDLDKIILEAMPLTENYPFLIMEHTAVGMALESILDEL